MKPRTAIAKTLTPDGKTVALYEHDGSYTIRVDGAELMSTRQHASEEKLAELACAHVRGKRGARVLIGGLGFGFTLRAALEALGRDATVVVAEILGAVIEWNRKLPVGAEVLADPRVKVVEGDVGAAIRGGRFDSIILDVDNGPQALSTRTNAGLYGLGGLREVRAALLPGGCAAIWSAAQEPEFERRMDVAGFRVEVHVCRSRPGGGSRHTVFLGRV